MLAILALSLHLSRRLLAKKNACTHLYTFNNTVQNPNNRLFWYLIMIVSSYIFDFKRYLKLLGFFPGFLPYDYHEGLICVSKNKMRHNFYRLSLLLSVFHCILTFLKLMVDKYDIFLTLLGATIISVSLHPLLVRWNWSCDTKFVDMFSQFIVFESHLKVQGFLKTPEGKYIAYKIY